MDGSASWPNRSPHSARIPPQRVRYGVSNQFSTCKVPNKKDENRQCVGGDGKRRLLRSGKQERSGASGHAYTLDGRTHARSTDQPGIPTDRTSGAGCDAPSSEARDVGGVASGVAHADGDGPSRDLWDDQTEGEENEHKRGLEVHVEGG